MRPWYLNINARNRVLVAILAGLAWGAGLVQAQLQESLPPQTTDRAAELRAEASSANDSLCAPLDDPPLSALAIDIRPRDADGRLVPANNTPPGCWQQTGKEGPPQFIGGGLGRCHWNCHDLLQLARFCHRPIYFEDVALERCGLVPSYPALHSVARFTWDLALLPAQLLIHKPCSYVRTPTPHCCAPSACSQ
jgi:hypothetical protein